MKILILLCIMMMAVVSLGHAHQGQSAGEPGETVYKATAPEGMVTSKHSVADVVWPAVLWWLPPAHPLLVHFPVVLLLLAGIVNGLAWRNPCGPWAARGRFLLYGGAIGALCAMASGLYFEAFTPHRHDGPIHLVMEWHETLGIITAAASVVISGIVACATRAEKMRWQQIGMLASCALALLVIATAHLGGLLVHRFGVGLSWNG